MTVLGRRAVLAPLVAALVTWCAVASPVQAASAEITGCTVVTAAALEEAFGVAFTAPVPAGPEFGDTACTFDTAGPGYATAQFPVLGRVTVDAATGKSAPKAFTQWSKSLKALGAAPLPGVGTKALVATQPGGTGGSTVTVLARDKTGTAYVRAVLSRSDGAGQIQPVATSSNTGAAAAAVLHQA